MVENIQKKLDDDVDTLDTKSIYDKLLSEYNRMNVLLQMNYSKEYEKSLYIKTFGRYTNK